MTTELVAQEQSRAEVKTYPVDFGPDLLTGISVVSAIAMLTLPGGNTVVCDVLVVTPIVYATVGPLTELGDHLLDVVATLNDAEISTVRLTIPVHY